jgi:hypothetical protein
MVFFLVSVLVVGSWWLWSRYSASDAEEANRAANLQGRRELREVPITSYVGHEIHPSLSPDGSQLAFAWDGGGSDGADIYVKVVGEDQALQLTATDDVEMFPSWSRNDICVVDAETGHSVLLAPSTHVDGMPSWSADGDEIYFASDRSGRPEIWKAAITETEPTQVTDHGALAAAMSVERSAILYYPDADPSPGNWAQELWRLSLDSGAAEKLLDRVYPFAHVDASNACSGSTSPIRAMNRPRSGSCRAPRARSAAWDVCPTGFSAFFPTSRSLRMSHGCSPCRPKTEIRTS